MNLAELSLLDFIEALSPQFKAPHHLAAWCKMIERVLTEPVRGLCAIPIRHYKTMTTLHGVAWLLVRNPRLRIILMCADHERATELGKMCRRLCEAAEIGPARGDNIIVDWKNKDGGGVVCMSAEQSKLGRDVDVLIFDDPITEQTANDPLVRESVDHAIAHYTARCQRAGSLGSVLGVMSPWHPDDPIGRRLARKAATWEYVRHPVINEDGTAFAPDIIDVAALKQIRAELAEQDPTERLWWAQFMCQPFTPSAQLFTEPARYDRMPEFGAVRTVYGFDAAFSQKKSADWFAIVATQWVGSAGFIRETRRFRADYDVAVREFTEMRGTWGPGEVYSYMSGPEIGSVLYFQERGINVNIIPARYDKRTRAQKTIDRWNRGGLAVPSAALAWVAPFVKRALAFRGIDGDEDDEIDAMVSACDGAGWCSVTSPTRTFGSPRMMR